MSKTIILYSTGCPQCRVLKERLDARGISYHICSDIEVMKAKGISSVPVLEVDGELLRMRDAFEWMEETV